jgi:ketosteroid isomerase-like protein
MPSHPSRKAPPLGSDSPDEVEARLYEAVNAGDVDALMACWADEDDIVCVHPGGPRFVGAASIRTGFEQIFRNAGPIRATPLRVRRVQTLSAAVHSVIERIQIGAPGQTQGEALVLATNVYVKTVAGWRLVAHHASPGTPAELQELSEGTRAVLH